MTEPAKCPQCSQPLPPGSPGGLCPACLLKRGLETNTVAPSACGGEGNHAWKTPMVDELAGLFPELDIIELIGRGGMGAVYKARQQKLDRLVALKILPPEIGRDPSFAQRFEREAQALARLSHPNIVMIHDFGKRTAGGGTGFQPVSDAAVPAAEDGGSGYDGRRHHGQDARATSTPAAPPDIYFFIMEYVDGLSLRQLLDAGGVSPKEALAIVPQICDALQYAHDRGIVHRDIKPENILLNRAGQVKIADFGLAKLVGRDAAVPAARDAGILPASPAGVPPAVQEEQGERDARPTRGPEARVTLGEKVMGTPQYMAPEQIDRPGAVDHRADIYSLGVVFYQMLTGELPSGKPGEFASRFEPPSRKVLIDVRLDEVVLRALEKEPERRYQQARQVRTEVETIVQTPSDLDARAKDWQTPKGPPARHDGVSPAVAKPGAASPRFSRTAIVGAFLLLPFAFFLLTTSGSPKSTAPAGVIALWICVLVVLVGTPISTTILGSIAISQIRHSAGRLYGLGLAVFDALLFPLLVVDALIIAACYNAAYQYGPIVNTSHGSLQAVRGNAWLLVLGVAICAVLDWLIVRWVWRAAKRPLSLEGRGQGASDSPAPPASADSSPSPGPPGHPLPSRERENSGGPRVPIGVSIAGFDAAQQARQAVKAPAITNAVSRILLAVDLALLAVFAGLATVFVPSLTSLWRDQEKALPALTTLAVSLPLWVYWAAAIAGAAILIGKEFMPWKRVTLSLNAVGLAVLAIAYVFGWVALGMPLRAMSSVVDSGPATQPGPSHSIGIYLITGSPRGVAFEKAPLKDFTLSPEPLISQKDIFEYDWESHTIRLKDQAAADRVLKIRTPPRGAFSVVVDGQRVYRGQLQSIATSVVSAVPQIHVEPGAGQWQPQMAIRIYPPPAGTPDPRGDGRLKQALQDMRLLSPNDEGSSQPSTRHGGIVGTWRLHRGPEAKGQAPTVTFNADGTVDRYTPGSNPQNMHGTYQLAGKSLTIRLSNGAESGTYVFTLDASADTLTMTDEHGDVSILDRVSPPADKKVLHLPAEILALLPADAKAKSPNGWDESSEPKANKWFAENLPARNLEYATRADIRRVEVNRVADPNRQYDTVRWDVAVEIELPQFEIDGQALRFCVVSVPHQSMTDTIVLSGDESFARRAKTLRVGEKLAFSGRIVIAAVRGTGSGGGLPQLLIGLSDPVITWPPATQSVEANGPVGTMEAAEFYVMGNVARPGVYPLGGRKITVKMALAMAGNPTDPEWPKKSTLVRRLSSDKEEFIPVNVLAILKGEHDDLLLRPDDLLVVGSEVDAAGVKAIRAQATPPPGAVVVVPQDQSKLPPQSAIALNLDHCWQSQDHSRAICLEFIPSEDSAQAAPAQGRPKFFCDVEKWYGDWWSYTFALPIDPQKYPIIVYTYRSRHNYKCGGLLSFQWPGHSHELSFDELMVTDGKVHALRADLRKFKWLHNADTDNAGLTRISIGSHRLGAGPAELEVLGIRFETEDGDGQPPQVDRPIPVKVVDDKGLPVQGAVVTADWEWLNWARSAATGKDGVATVTPLVNPAGRHVLRVSKPGMATIDIGGPGQASLPAVVTLPRGVRYGGVVQNEDGKPLADVFISLNVACQTQGPADYPLYLRTDDKGRWRTPTLPPAQNVSVRLWHKDYVTDSADGSIPAGPLDKMEQEASVLVMKKGLVLAGAVVDRAGKPIEGASVIIGRSKWEHDPRPESGKDGRFRIANVVPGETMLTVWIDGLAPQVLHLSVAKDTTDLRVQLAAVKAVRGRIVDSAGKPVAGARVRVDSWQSLRTVGWTTVTARDGSFICSGPPPGPATYTIIRPPGQDQEPLTITLSPSDEEQVIRLDSLKAATQPTTAPSITSSQESGNES